MKNHEMRISLLAAPDDPPYGDTVYQTQLKEFEAALKAEGLVCCPTYKW